MPTTISEEVRAVFSADTTNLVDGADRSIKKIREVKKAYGEKVGNVKGTILDPSSLITKGIGKLTSSMKLSAFTAGAVAAGVEFAGQALQNFKAEAASAKQEADALSESMRKLSNANRITSAAEGSSSLVGRLPALREAQQALKAQDADLNPPDAHFLGAKVKSVAQIALDARYAANYGTKAQEHLDTDRLENQLRQRDLAQEEARIRGQITGALGQDLRLSDNRLRLDQQTSRIDELRLQQERELNEQKAAGLATPENRSLVELRYGDQVKAAEEARSAGENQFRLQREANALQLSALTTEQQSLAMAERRVTLIDKELKTRQFITTEEQRSLILERESNANAVQLAQRLEFGKSPGQINRGIYQMQRRRTRNAQIDAQINRTDGLVGVTRDMDDNIISGYDPVTGEVRAPRAGFVQTGTSLVSGHVGDKSGFGGARDMDAGGGLHGGSTPRMFEESDASKFLSSAPSVEGALASWRGDSAHDPAARLAGKSVFGAAAVSPASLQKDRGEHTSTGHTALDAARATVTAIDKGNDILRSIHNLMEHAALG